MVELMDKKYPKKEILMSGKKWCQKLSTSPHGNGAKLIENIYRLSMEYLCKTTTSSYAVCLKRTLENNQASVKGDPALLTGLKKAALPRLNKMHSVT